MPPAYQRFPSNNSHRVITLQSQGLRRINSPFCTPRRSQLTSIKQWTGLCDLRLELMSWPHCPHSAVLSCEGGAIAAPASTKCQWSSDMSSVTIFFHPSLLLDIGDGVVLQPQVVRAACPFTVEWNCTGWKYAPRHGISIVAASHPIPLHQR